jgi:delta 1-pyrroline-5-carboxylate dehydrogenase
MSRYRSYPRIVGETGGKDFIVAHPSADPQALAVAIVRGSFEYQGQKCSAASRVYVPRSLWSDVRDRAVAMMREIRVGDVADFRNFMGAVIDARAFEKIGEYLAEAKRSAKVVSGGNAHGEKGWFIEPTLVETDDPGHRLLCEEIFGPVVTAHVYDDAKWTETLRVIDATSPYALTGSVFAQDRTAVAEASSALRQSAGNFYINDKCTGAVVGQQPFGGARGSGTNDKAGSMLNLVRWVSARTIRETFSRRRISGIRSWRRSRRSTAPSSGAVAGWPARPWGGQRGRPARAMRRFARRLDHKRLRTQQSDVMASRPITRPEDQLRLVLVVATTPQADVVRRRTSPQRVGVDVVELDERPLGAPPSVPCHEGALPAILTPGHAPGLIRYVA